MEIKRRIEILIETQRQIVVHDFGSSGDFNCRKCGETVIAAEHAAVIFGISRRAVYRFVERETVHFVETEAGAVMVCLSSLTAILGGGDQNQSPSASGGDFR